MSVHPISMGRRAALNDSALWHPMSGIVGVAASHFATEPEKVAEVIWKGMAAGTIAHRAIDRTDRSWIVDPRGAELLRRSGISYEEHLDWECGCLKPPEAAPIPMELFWPDIEKAMARPTRQSQAQPGKSSDGGKRGPKGGLTRKTADAILVDLQARKMTPSYVTEVGQEAIAAQYGNVSRDTIVKAWRIALLEFEGDKNTDK